jgi:hypothetical protein
VLAGTPEGNGHHAILFGAVTLALLGLHLVAAARIGFGDSEALYASYALHPQPAYLDHPGLVGLVARAIGGGTAPSPARAHVLTSVLCAGFPFAMALACRAAGSAWKRALAVATVVSLVPEIAVGLFALTPDLLLALAWTTSLAFAAAGLRASPGSPRATGAFAAAGLLAGVAATAKASGVLLLLALAATYAARPSRAHARTIAPWAGLAAGALAVAPVLLFEAHSGWPMLRHRLVDTQADAGWSLRNAGALVGGQLLYLSPLTAVLAALSAREAFLARSEDAVGRLLFTAFAIPMAFLAPLCLWSRVAEPHWIAPALLSLGPAVARSPRAPSRRLVVAAAALSAFLVGVVHAWVLSPGLLAFAPASYDARVDIANELRGWPEVVEAVRREAVTAWNPGSERGDLVVVGPHWIVCAQLEAALRGELPVGCDTPVPDDFDTWYPRSRWRSADALLWVSDERFGPPPRLPDYVAADVATVRVQRGGRTVRVFTVTWLTRRAPA